MPWLLRRLPLFPLPERAPSGRKQTVPGMRLARPGITDGALCGWRGREAERGNITIALHHLNDTSCLAQTERAPCLPVCAELRMALIPVRGAPGAAAAAGTPFHNFFRTLRMGISRGWSNAESSGSCSGACAVDLPWLSRRIVKSRRPHCHTAAPAWRKPCGAAFDSRIPARWHFADLLAKTAAGVSGGGLPLHYPHLNLAPP